MMMQKITRRVTKILVVFSLSLLASPSAYSHKYWGDDYDYFCDDAHSIRDENFDSELKDHSRRCYDIPEGTYRVEKKDYTPRAEWEECPKGSYCPGGSAGKIKPDIYSVAPDEEMSKPIACPKNKISDKKRLTCSYPKNLLEWGEFLDTKPKGSKYKDGRLVCKKGKNYSKQKGICR